MPSFLWPAACFVLASASLLACACTSCSGLGPRSGRSISLVSYNAMNLFDATDQGGEYPEFSVRGGAWDEAKYRLRLARLAEAVAPKDLVGSGPDILCLVEIENPSVIEALRSGPLKRAGYTSALMSPAEGSPINSAMLSRLPLLSLRAHATAAGPEGKARAGRRILEAEFDAGACPLVVVLCHWKSKLEGAGTTEAERREAAALVRGIVARRLAEGRPAIIVCGDFNESPDEYLRVGRRYPTALMLLGEAPPGSGPPRLLVTTRRSEASSSGMEPVLYSPWGESQGFSYAYSGEKARIDGFLLGSGLLAGGPPPGGPSLRYQSFSVIDPP
ncbi:MAG TPA: endonuclease/exonuclease/phosphatase family protein, partial [Rectinemataceae bacterium]|nr:endonuclease/exonuclease/phosphatase family protein [Rectinemataceae bacterium]